MLRLSGGISRCLPRPRIPACLALNGPPRPPQRTFRTSLPAYDDKIQEDEQDEPGAKRSNDQYRTIPRDTAPSYEDELTRHSRRAREASAHQLDNRQDSAPSIRGSQPRKDRRHIPSKGTEPTEPRPLVGRRGRVQGEQSHSRANSHGVIDPLRGGRLPPKLELHTPPNGSDTPEASAAPPRVKTNEPIGALSDEEIALFRQAARQSKVRSTGSSINAAGEDAKDSKGAISILEELFPRELNRRSQLQKSARHVPKAPLDLPTGDEAMNNNLVTSIPTEADVQSNQTMGLDNQTAVLVLRKASKHLTDEDFRRHVPGGRHIEGWTTQGSLLRVIRARDADTLEHSGDYFLVFSNAAIATDYMNYASKLHRHSRAFTPRVLQSSVPPPPTRSKDGKAKFDSPAYIYNLVVPSHDLYMRLIHQPFAPMLRQLVSDSSYRDFFEGSQSDHEVLLSFPQYWSISFSVVRRAIGQDGKHRGSFWQTTGEQSGIRVLGENLGQVVPKEDRSSGNAWHVKTRRFIVSFHNPEEASRFVISWHRRDVTRLIEAQLPESWRSGTIIANAELTW